MANLAFTNCAALLDAVAQELDRDDLLAQIPGFLVLAQSDINADIQWTGAVVHWTPTCSTDFVTLPADFLTPISLTVTNQSGIGDLAYVTPTRLSELRAMNLTGCPLNYTIVGDQIWFDRTPTNVAVDIAYFNGVAPLVLAADTNTLFATFPALYFYATLLHSAPFLKDDSRIALWSKLYEDNVTRVRLRTERLKRGFGPLVVRTARGFR